MANLNKQIDQDRNWAISRANQLDQQNQGQIVKEGSLRNWYDQAGSDYYAPALAGQGGYNDSEKAAILREQDLNAAKTTPDEYSGNYLTPEEQAAIQGQPDKYFNPDAMMGVVQDSAGRQREAAGSIGSGMKAAITPDLVADQGALTDIRMTPEEEQRMVTAAGTSAGLARQAQIGDLGRSARAAGMNVLGVAAARDRYERAADAEAADAMTNARIAASNARSGRAATAEGIRLGAAQDVSGRKMTAANTGGQAKLSAEQDIGTGLRQQQQYNAGLGTQIEGEESGRAASVATNRQGVNQGNATQRYQQEYDTNQALSGRSQDIADKRLSQGSEAADYNTHLGDKAYQAEQGGYDRTANLYSQESNNRSNAVGQSQTQSQIPGTASKVASGILGGISAVAKFIEDGGIVTEPTLAVVGEAGPEAVVPLSDNPDAKLRPGFIEKSVNAPKLPSWGQQQRRKVAEGLGTAADIGSAALNGYQRAGQLPAPVAPVQQRQPLRYQRVAA
jgi:hypothetical protein